MNSTLISQLTHTVTADSPGQAKRLVTRAVELATPFTCEPMPADRYEIATRDEITVDQLNSRPLSDGLCIVLQARIDHIDADLDGHSGPVTEALRLKLIGARDELIRLRDDLS